MSLYAAYQGCRGGRVASCGALLPATLSYTAEQRFHFGEPEEHERTWAQTLTNPKYNGSMQGEIPARGLIHPNYKKHLQNLLAIIQQKCGGLHKRYEICDVALIRVKPRGHYIHVDSIETRVCIQGQGIMKLILSQLIKVCQCSERALLIVEPVEYIRNMLESIFGKNDVREIKQFLINVKFDEGNISYEFLDNDFFQEMPKPKQNMINTIIGKHFYLITSERMQMWKREERSNWEACNLYKKLGITDMVVMSPPHYTSGNEDEDEVINSLVTINPSYFPSADELNNQEYVDAKFEESKRARLERRLRRREENV